MMKAKFKRYDDYKNSRVDWIGEVPEHWDIKRLKDLAEIKGGKDFKDVSIEEGGFPVYGSGGIFGRASQCLYTKPSVLLGRKGTIDKPLFVKEPFWTVDTMYFTEISKSTYPNFFHYLCLTIRFGFYQCGSALPSMTQKDLSNILFCCPKFDEQKAIADYLDTKTDQIDQKIDLLTKKATLYGKLKQSLINESVTRGLDKTVAMKDSAVEWIGEVPEHWEVKRLKELGFLFSGLSGKKGDDFTDEHEFSSNFIPFVNIANNQYISTTDIKKVIVYPNEKQNKVKKNDLFFLMSSENHEDIGKSALLKVDIVDTYLNSFCRGFRFTKKDIVANFVNYLLTSVKCRNSISVEGKRFTRINLKIEKINNLP